MSGTSRRSRKTYNKSSYKRKGRKQSSNENTNKAPKQTMYCCPVPHNKCSGTTDKQQQMRFHSSSKEVMRCKCRYLKSQGYKQLSAREFENPETGAVLILSAKSPLAKPGKADRYMGRHVGTHLY